MMKLNKRLNELQNEKNLFAQQIKKVSELLKNQKENSQMQFKAIEQLAEESDKLKFEMDKSEKKILEWMSLKAMEENEKKLVLHQNELLTSELQISIQEMRNLQYDLNKKEKDIKTIVDDYNNLLSERKALQKKLLETKGLTKDYEFKIHHLYSEIEHFKKIVDVKEDLNEKMRHKIKSLEYDYFRLDDKVKHGTLDIRSLKNTITEKELEKSILNDLLRKGEKLRITMMRDIDRLRQDIKILKTTIQRRNAETALKDEKVELMNVIMKNGENEYKQRLTDLGLLKTEVLKLRAEKRMLTKTVENNGNLKKEIFYLQRELTQEKQKSRALEEQMENPINVHRWRILEGKDPEKNELIQKTQLLQKKLFQTDEKYSKLLEKLKNLEVTYCNLKKFLEELPGGPECAQNLSEAKRLLRNKTTENQRLAAEAAAYSNEYRQIKKRMEETKKEADETKRKYLELKIKIDRDKMKKITLPEKQISPCKTKSISFFNQN